MDRITNFIKQYRYVILVLIIGAVLMLLPTEREGTPGPVIQETDIQENSMEEKLALILSRVEGAGQVEVLLTQEAGEEILYVSDEDRSSGTNGESLRQEAVVITDAQRNEQGLVRQVNPPKYQGAVIVCQGADSPAVRLSIVEAVCDAAGLTADKITVLKMK